MNKLIHMVFVPGIAWSVLVWLAAAGPLFQGGGSGGFGASLEGSGVPQAVARCANATAPLRLPFFKGLISFPTPCPANANAAPPRIRSRVPRPHQNASRHPSSTPPPPPAMHPLNPPQHIRRLSTTFAHFFCVHVLT